MAKTLTREIHPEVRVLDARRGLVRYVASDQTLDHYKEVILANGWRFDLFSKNAPFVDSHNYDCVDRLLGRVTDYKVEGRQLIEEVQWAVDVGSNALAKLGFEMTEKGYLTAVSVGFIPVKSVSKNDGEWSKVCHDAGLDQATREKCKAVYVEQQQIELSACIIGANPNALAKAYHAGDINEEQMHLLGLDNDEAVEFLDSAAKVWDHPTCDALTRTLIRRELRRSYDSATTGSPAWNRAASDPRPGDEAEITKREAFLAKLRAITR